MDLYELLNKLDINYKEVSHKPIYTIEEADTIVIDLPGVKTKNLFLKDKHNFYLYVLTDHKRADIKGLRRLINSGELSFANEKQLKNKLNLYPGSVTPLGLIYNKERDVVLVLDKELEEQIIWSHPNTNTKTMAIYINDLIKFSEYLGNKWTLI